MQLYVSTYFRIALSKAVMPRNEASYIKVHTKVNGQILCAIVWYYYHMPWMVTMEVNHWLTVVNEGGAFAAGVRVSDLAREVR